LRSEAYGSRRAGFTVAFLFSLLAPWWALLVASCGSTFSHCELLVNDAAPCGLYFGWLLLLLASLSNIASGICLARNAFQFSLLNESLYNLLQCLRPCCLALLGYALQLLHSCYLTPFMTMVRHLRPCCLTAYFTLQLRHNCCLTLRPTTPQHH
jgi:hypothetical protein